MAVRFAISPNYHSSGIQIRGNVPTDRPLSVAAWVNVGAWSASYNFPSILSIYKTDGGNVNYLNFGFDDGFGAVKNYSLVRRYSGTVEATVRSADNSVDTTDKWQFICGVDNGAGVPLQMYVGDENTVAAEPSTYPLQDTPSGTPEYSSLAEPWIGNRIRLDNGFPGAIAFVGVYDGALTAEQIREIQLNPLAYSSRAFGLWTPGITEITSTPNLIRPDSGGIITAGSAAISFDQGPRFIDPGRIAKHVQRVSKHLILAKAFAIRSATFNSASVSTATFLGVKRASAIFSAVSTSTTTLASTKRSQAVFASNSQSTVILNTDLRASRAYNSISASDFQAFPVGIKRSAYNSVSASTLTLVANLRASRSYIEVDTSTVTLTATKRTQAIFNAAGISTQTLVGTKRAQASYNSVSVSTQTLITNARRAAQFSSISASVLALAGTKKAQAAFNALSASIATFSGTKASATKTAVFSASSTSSAIFSATKKAQVAFNSVSASTVTFLGLRKAFRTFASSSASTLTLLGTKVGKATYASVSTSSLALTAQFVGSRTFNAISASTLTLTPNLVKVTIEDTTHERLTNYLNDKIEINYLDDELVTNYLNNKVKTNWI